MLTDLQETESLFLLTKDIIKGLKTKNLWFDCRFLNMYVCS